MADLVVEETGTAATPALREGRDFHNQREFKRLRPASRAQPMSAPFVAELAAAVLSELRIFEHTGCLPGGTSWSEQPAWRGELWQAYWQAQRDAAEWLEPHHPRGDQRYD